MVPAEMTPADVVQQYLREALHEATKDTSFTFPGPGDLELRTSTKIAKVTPFGVERLEKPEVTFFFEALSPRGAIFLGELASVGFFGVEAQQLLSF